MTTPAPRFWQYGWDGGRECLMSFGPESGAPSLLIIPPLLEELNRTRKFLSDIMRLLADDGVASHLADLPGTGESDRGLEETSWEDWRISVAAAARAVAADAVLSVRGGCLL
ncbi:MAG: hypothetical protein HKN78_10140, partial [Sphingomonadaceae bacterium]|nr:hypothetical protein [Sphingomonadaceae bacterium]